MEINPITSKYLIRNKIGAGSFGEIFEAISQETGETVAIKQEKVKQRRPYLENEYAILKSLQGGIGIPRVFQYWSDSRNYLSMELLGQNLETLFRSCRGKFSLKTVLMIADQCISRLEYVHSRLLLHRDIKPENFVIGTSKKSHVIYLIDFGLSKRFADPATLKHIKYREGKSLTGTARYVSCFTHAGIEHSRRDDLESLGYLFIYLLKGTLPWIGLQTETKAEKYHQISIIKSTIQLESLVSPHPVEFMNYLSYCKSLNFDEKPNYFALKKGFKDLFLRLNYFYDYLFSWDLKRNPTPKRNASVCKERREKELSRRDISNYTKKDQILSNMLTSINYLPIIKLSKNKL